MMCNQHQRKIAVRSCIASKHCKSNEDKTTTQNKNHKQAWVSLKKPSLFKQWKNLP